MRAHPLLGDREDVFPTRSEYTSRTLYLQFNPDRHEGVFVVIGLYFRPLMIYKPTELRRLRVTWFGRSLLLLSQARPDTPQPALLR